MIRPFDSLILRTMLEPLVASLQLFAIYVLLHGHYSPGGGFQAGILLAASMILPQLATGDRAGKTGLSTRGAAVLTAVGVLLFAGIGVVSLFWDHPMLDYSVLPVAEALAERRSIGILVIEVGVGLAVAGAMLSIFYALTGDIGEDEEKR
jgi:multicomponent Na+:H+ antiporter subunit B